MSPLVSDTIRSKPSEVATASSISRQVFMVSHGRVNRSMQCLTHLCRTSQHLQLKKNHLGPSVCHYMLYFDYHKYWPVFFLTVCCILIFRYFAHVLQFCITIVSRLFFKKKLFNPIKLGCTLE